MSIINGIKGFLIGIAMVIPGLSGSIFAIVVGLYDGIIETVSNFQKNVKANIIFLLPIGIGCAIGILASTKAVLWLCESYRLQSYMFFIGLVLGAFPLIFRKMFKIKFNPVYLLFVILSFSAIVFTSNLGAGTEKSYVAITHLSGAGDFLTLMFAGVFSVSLMMIPGISGSVMLMVIGQYGTVYNAVGACLDFAGFILKGNFEAAGESFMTIILVLPFAIGALIGIIFIAKLLNFLLKKWESQVYYCVLGLVIGAIAVLGMESGIGPIVSGPSAGIMPFIISAAFIALGFVCTVFLDNPKEK
ncbi:DUF368 domain-containing protein [Tyzzerella sp. OttesenSCG-928-J15]|nr:DUF368 domain-containing protein [Tyzzerella sp. OttesenSCG-928-J15]